jgi:multiple sugar transport system ATP-binding protein
MAEVVLQNLAKTYPDGARTVSAVKSINLTVADREFMVLVGPSGCGKSTTLRMIAGLEEITGGTVTIGGRVVNDLPPKDRDIAMVFQNYALYPHMTVYENMAFGLTLRKMPHAEIDSRVREAADLLGLADYLDRKPKALSGGQRQRVAVGRAIVRHPKVFLFDEPLSNLDAKMRTAMRTEISRLHARLGATMIYVTHDQIEAMTMGDRICVMRDGVIMQVATPLQLYNEPANLFVAGFIGSPPMNFISGTVTTQPASGGALFVADDNALQLPLSNVLTSRAAAHAGRPLLLGVRPEHLSLAVGDGATAVLEVDLVEPTGAETLIHLRSGGRSLIARVKPTDRVTRGQRIAFAFDLAHAHLFDPATEQVLR